MKNKKINTFFKALAPKTWTTKEVISCLVHDPYQTRISKFSIPLTHPRTNQCKPLSEFVEDLIGDSRFAIETKDNFIFISMITNSATGRIFLPTKVFPKNILDKKDVNEIYSPETLN
jgi:hypothetical protein